MAGRVHKSILNAKVNLVFYLLSLFLAFFSRKIFLDCLGAEFIGLTGTLNNILGYLNLAELGIGSCIAFFLYKPLQEGNQQKTGELLSLIGYLYSRIGRAILLAGLLVSLSFPWMFANESLGLGIVYFSFFSILGSALIGYFINYRQVLLSADQKNYLVAIYFQSAGLAKTVLQIVLAYTYQNFYLWVAVEFLFGILGCIVLNWKINKEYPWLKTDKRQGRELLRRYPEVMGKTRQIFIHKIKDFLLYKSDELFVFAFVSLKMVAHYGNYTLIISRAGQVFSAMLDSVAAGVGNLIAEGNKRNTMKVFWELLTVRHFVAGLLAFAIYHFIEPFICLWLGEGYLLDREILVLLVVNIYINSSRGAVDMFNFSHGLFADVWAAWTELALNVGITLVAGYYWGIAGILLGKTVSMTLIIVFWKPYYLFHDGLHESYASYWGGALRNYLVSLTSMLAAHFALPLFGIDAYANLGSWCLFSAAGLGVYLAANLPLTMLFCPGANGLLDRLKRQKH